MTFEAPLIRDFMTPEPYAIDQSLSVADAADRMRAHDIRHLLVLEGQVLRGMVSLSDLHLALALSEEDAASTSIEEALRPAMICSPLAYLSSVLRDMEGRRLDDVVVINRDNEVVGIFTLTDAMRAARSLANHFAADPMQEVERGDVPDERERTLPRVRVKRMLDHRHASPVHANGLLMGQVMV